MTPAVLERLRRHPWKGNVRELEHVVEMLVLFTESDTIGEEDLPRAMRAGTQAAPTASVRFDEAVRQFERTLLAEAIERAGGVKAEAARRLGLDANQIKYLCRKHKLQRVKF
jgi:DNA-binding NtrC family response regulator